MMVRRERMQRAVEDGFMNATDVADYLAERGVPFRDAHEITGRIVQFCLANNKRIDDLTVDEFKRFSAKFDKSIYDYLKVEAVVARRSALGGTARQNVLRRLKELRTR